MSDNDGNFGFGNLCLQKENEDEQESDTNSRFNCSEQPHSFKRKQWNFNEGIKGLVQDRPIIINRKLEKNKKFL